MDFLRDGTIHPGLFLYGIISRAISLVCYLVAKDTGRNQVIAAVIGIIHGLNYFAIA